MKIRTVQSANIQGSVLLVSFCTAFVAGLTLASYLLLVKNQSTSVARSQTWNNNMVVTEAGIEDGLQLINKFVTAIDPNALTNWTVQYGEDNWTKVSANTYYVRRTLSTSPSIYYDVWVTNNSALTGPSVYSIGYVPPAVDYSAGYSYGCIVPVSFLAQVNQSTTPTMVSRRVSVQTTLDSLFNAAMAAKGQINMNGNNITTDSFDSADTNYSAGGQYTSTKHKANGNVYTDGDVVNTLSVGNADIYGKIKTGPTGTPSIGPNGRVGDLSWAGPGIQPGFYKNDMNVNFTDVTLPTTTWLTPTVTSYRLNGVTYSYAILSPGDYTIPSLSGSLFIGTNAGIVRLQVTGNISLNGQDQIAIAPGSTLKLYMAGTSAAIGGNGVVNWGGTGANAENFIYYGLPSNTSISMSGNGTFLGALYAPEANLTLNGGGNANNDFMGATVTKTVTMNGHFSFHYDENLARYNAGRGYIPISWTEN